eukprot:SAG11_NODE_5596_length_1514_cov_1.370318_2_plen_95_part_01
MDLACGGNVGTDPSHALVPGTCSPACAAQFTTWWARCGFRQVRVPTPRLGRTAASPPLTATAAAPRRQDAADQRSGQSYRENFEWFDALCRRAVA